MKKRNQKKIADYFAFLDQVFEPEKKINPGLKKIAGAIVEKKRHSGGIPVFDKSGWLDSRSGKPDHQKPLKLK